MLISLDADFCPICGLTDIVESSNSPSGLMCSNCGAPISTDIPKLEQDDELLLGSYGGRKLVWKVIDVIEDHAYLLAKDILTLRAFHGGGFDASWEQSSLHEWLNGEFFDASFSIREQTFVEQLLLLSKAEANLLDKKDRQASFLGKPALWLLRSPDGSPGFINAVDGNGATGAFVSKRDCAAGVRPGIFVRHGTSGSAA